jgi:predicted dithiol-disulfide oxidoreductase (DUF899 family)
MADRKVVCCEEWAAAREELLAREKQHTRLGDELARKRRELPWVRVEKQYRFDTDDGEKALVELFDGRSQLLVYHFMFGPSYEAGCPTCSSIGDAVNGVLPHLHARDVTFVFVSQAPLDKLQAYHAYSTTGRGVEFLMGYYPILDRAPKGRDEGGAWQVWIRRHDEY